METMGRLWSIFSEMMHTIEPVNTLIGLGTFVFTVLIWWMVRRQNQLRYARWLQEASSESGERPAALIIDYWDKGEIDVQVKSFLRKRYPDSFPDESIFQIGSNIQLTPLEMPTIARELREAGFLISKYGANKLHVFIAAPMPVAMLVGAELSNWGRVHIYHMNRSAQQNEYEDWGPLKHFNL
ncbi:MAG: SAVED domain-containing protein [Neomegalonema sp.]|nr:SAVED domain-containing protein [Neomegalonema sp.]